MNLSPNLEDIRLLSVFTRFTIELFYCEDLFSCIMWNSVRMYYNQMFVIYCTILMYSFNAAQLLLSISLYATHEIVICVLLDVFDIIRHNKSASVQLKVSCVFWSFMFIGIKARIQFLQRVKKYPPPPPPPEVF